MLVVAVDKGVVSTHSRLKAAGSVCPVVQPFGGVSTHSRLKAAGGKTSFLAKSILVSTHSRLKAAGRRPFELAADAHGFNTQPPEGGWPSSPPSPRKCTTFQHTAA